MERTIKAAKSATPVVTRLLYIWKTASEKATIDFRTLNHDNDASVCLSSMSEGKTVIFRGWCYIDLIGGRDTIVATSLTAETEGMKIQLA